MSRGAHSSRRKRRDAGLGPREPNAGPSVDVFVEVAAVHSEETHHLTQAALESGVQTAGVDVDQAGRQIGEQRLEPNAVLEKAVRAAGRPMPVLYASATS